MIKCTYKKLYFFSRYIKEVASTTWKSQHKCMYYWQKVLHWLLIYKLNPINVWLFCGSDSSVSKESWMLNPLIKGKERCGFDWCSKFYWKDMGKTPWVTEQVKAKDIKKEFIHSTSQSLGQSGKY